VVIGKPGTEPRSISTFGLTEPELRSEARRLYAAGWTVAEITAVLAVEPGGGR
jgi:hypothetical protein